MFILESEILVSHTECSCVGKWD